MRPWNLARAGVRILSGIIVPEDQQTITTHGKSGIYGCAVDYIVLINYCTNESVIMSCYL